MPKLKDVLEAVIAKAEMEKRARREKLKNMTIENLKDEENYLTDEQFNFFKERLKKIKEEQTENDQQVQLLKSKLDWVLRKPTKKKIRIRRVKKKETKEESNLT